MQTDCYEKGHTPFFRTGGVRCYKCREPLLRAVTGDPDSWVWHTQAELDRPWEPAPTRVLAPLTPDELEDTRVADARRICDRPQAAAVTQAIPPAYTEFIGTQLLAYLRVDREAARILSEEGR